MYNVDRIIIREILHCQEYMWRAVCGVCWRVTSPPQALFVAKTVIYFLSTVQQRNHL